MQTKTQINSDHKSNNLSGNNTLLDTIIESLFEGIIILDNAGKIIMHNSKFREIWKMPLEMIESKDGDEILNYALRQTDAPGVFYGKIKNIRTGENKDFGLMNLLDGRIIEYFLASLRLDSENRGFVGIFRDITERTRMLIKFEEYTTNLENIVKLRTEQISNLNKQLIDEIEKSKIAERLIKAALEKEKEVSRLKSSFISTASHEFKTPMTTILSSVDLMETFWENKNYSKFIEHKDKIKSKIHSLIKLVDDVLVVHQIEKNAVTIKNEKMNLKEVIQELLDEVRVIDKQNHNLIFNYKSRKTIIESDPKIYRHVITNLLINSVKYTPAGGNITLEVNQSDGFVKIIITDEGPGIDQENLNHIFEPFERGKYHGDKEGSGLGLSIVKYTLDLCNGNIEVVSKKNKGTSFFVTIPLSKK